MSSDSSRSQGPDWRPLEEALTWPYGTPVITIDASGGLSGHIHWDPVLAKRLPALHAAYLYARLDTIAAHRPQPMTRDEAGTVRFRANTLVIRLLEAAEAGQRTDLYSILADNAGTPDDREQLLQLLGYNLRDYGQQAYVRQEAYEAAEREAARLGHTSTPSQREERRL